MQEILSNSHKNRLLIIGGGELAKQINNYVVNYDKSIKIIGFVSDNISPTNKFSLPYLGKTSDIRSLYKANTFDKLTLAIGYNHFNFREEIFDRLNDEIPFYSFVHPNSFIDKTSTIGNGCVICSGVVIEQGVQVGNNVFIYNSVSISHDSKIGDHSFIAPSVSMAGFTKIGKKCFIGVNSTIINNITIGNEVYIGAGSLVVKHISKQGTYYGSPIKL